MGYRAVSAVTEDVLVRFIEGKDFWELPLYSKYAFLGALRSAAQMVPYEVSIGLILIVRLVCERVLDRRHFLCLPLARRSALTLVSHGGFLESILASV